MTEGGNHMSPPVLATGATGTLGGQAGRLLRKRGLQVLCSAASPEAAMPARLRRSESAAGRSGVVSCPPPSGPAGDRMGSHEGSDRR